MPVDGPFSLAAAASFGFGPNTGRPVPGDDAVMRLAFVTDDLRHCAGVLLRQDADGSLSAQISGGADAASVELQVRRILSLDRPAGGWVQAGRTDPVLGQLQAAHPGLRPVLFHSPYEAAAWAMLSQRRHRSQAAALRRALSQALGQGFDLDGQQEYAFPLPEQLADLGSFPGLEPQRAERLREVARRALAGDLDPAGLASAQTAQALAALRQIPGLGPVYASLVLLRAAGVSNAFTGAEPRLGGYVRHFWDLPYIPGGPELEQMAELWRPFRTWASVLIRVAGDRAGLGWQSAAPPAATRRR